MTRKLRLQDVSGCWILVFGCTLGVGCAATGGSKFRAAPGAKSVSSIGDQKLPPVVGTTGSQVVADTPSVEPIRDSKARISGRVIDADGYAVAGAVVRLADGGPKAGRDVRNVTDASGAFTLGNLRAGSTYTLVAEADFGDESGIETGQIHASTADTGVQIRLGTIDEAAARPKRTSKRAAKTRSVSERVDGNLQAAAPGGINSEDLGSPVADADVVVPAGIRSMKRIRQARSTEKDNDSAASWHRPGLEAGSRSDVMGDQDAAAPADDPDAPLDLDFDPGAGAKRRPTRAIETDSDNPLPPARTKPVDSDDESVRPTKSKVSQILKARRVNPVDVPEFETVEPGQLSFGSVPKDESPSALAGTGDLLEMPTVAQLVVVDSAVAESDAVPSGSGPVAPPPGFPDPNQPLIAATPSPATFSPGGAVFEPNPGGQSLPIPADPVALTPAPAPVDPSSSYNPFALAGAGPPRLAPTLTPTIQAATSSSDLPSVPMRRTGLIPADQADAITPASAEITPPRPKKWGEVATVAGVGAAATGAIVAIESATPTRIVTQPTRPSPMLTRRTTRSASTRADAPAFCQFDSKTNQLIDFQLPDLDGQPVRFRDVEADYVLFDFWGSWCQPCIDSIPHLIELQNTYGTSRLKIVGVACEKNAPDKRKAVVAAAADRLGINYPVVISNMDGNCPVQRAFGVQNYPTTILVDRRGKIVFRAVGNTESNTFRLDKALANAAKPVQTARR